MKTSHLSPLLLILLSTALIACAPIQAPAATSTTPASEATVETSEAEATADAIAVVAVDTTDCEAVQTAIAERLGVEMAIEMADFASEVANQQGQACTISATGTGQEFGNFVDTAQAIREVLLADGWVENEAHHADGPTGTVSGYAKENQLAFVQVDWQPSAAVQCPADQPISACNVEPSQQIFTVKIALMQTS